MKPPGKGRVAGSPGDWLAYAESDLNLARLAKDHKDIKECKTV
jgi:hypothetical protein